MKFFKLSLYFFYKLQILSLLFLSISTIQIYSCFDCCTNDSIYIKPSSRESIDKKEEKTSNNFQIYEKFEKKESLSQIEDPIQLQAEEKIIITPPSENNNKEQLLESAPHFIDDTNNTKDNFYSPSTLEKKELLDSKNIPSSQTTSTNSVQLGNNRSDDSAQIAFNSSLHKLHPAEQAIIFSQIRLSINQNSYHSSSNYKNSAKNNEFYTTNQAKHNNDNDDNDNTAQNSQPSTIDSMVAKAAWATAIFQSDSNSTGEKTLSEGAKSFSKSIQSICQNENSGIEKS